MFAPLSGSMTIGEVGRVFRWDVPFGRDYVFDAVGEGTAMVVLKSVQYVPTQGDVAFPVFLDVRVDLLAGSTVFATGIVEGVEVDGQATPLNVPLQVLGTPMSPDERRIDADRDINVRIGVATRATVYEYGGVCVEEVCLPEGETQVDPAPSRVVMLLDGSFLELPILRSEQAGGVIDLPASGALFTLRLPAGDAAQRYVNPGRGTNYEVTVRNEGLNPDVARLSLEVTDADWQVQVAPAHVELDVGEKTTIKVRVVAPDDAEEGARLELKVVATSGLDPEAGTRLPLVVTATRGQVIPDADGPLAQEVEKGSPAPAVGAWLVALAAWARTRRRQAA